MLPLIETKLKYDLGSESTKVANKQIVILTTCYDSFNQAKGPYSSFFLNDTLDTHSAALQNWFMAFNA